MIHRGSVIYSNVITNSLNRACAWVASYFASNRTGLEIRVAYFGVPQPWYLSPTIASFWAPKPMYLHRLPTLPYLPNPITLPIRPPYRIHQCGIIVHAARFWNCNIFYHGLRSTRRYHWLFRCPFPLQRSAYRPVRVIAGLGHGPTRLLWGQARGRGRRKRCWGRLQSFAQRQPRNSWFFIGGSLNLASRISAFSLNFDCTFLMMPVYEFCIKVELLMVSRWAHRCAALYNRFFM